MQKIKNCLVIPMYFGERRRIFKNEQDVLELAEYWYDALQSTNPGVDTDVVFVNNSPFNETANEFFRRINGKRIKRGKIIVIEGNNIGLSFGAFNAAYKAFEEEYDYWYFTEDDIILNRDNYFKDAILQLQSDEKLAYVSTTGLNTTYPMHAHGGSGCVSKKHLQEVCENFDGCLPHYKQRTDVLHNYASTHIPYGEISFSHCYVKLGYKLATQKNKCFIRWHKNDAEGLNSLDVEMWGVEEYVKSS